MRRGAKPAKAKVEAKLPSARKSGKNKDSRVRDLEKRVAEALQREAEAVKREAETQEQQTATAEIVRGATRLCDATFGTVFRFDGELIVTPRVSPSGA